MSKKWPWARKMWKLLAQRTSWSPWSYSIFFFSETWCSFSETWMFIHGLIDWQKNLRLLDWVTSFFNTSGATYGGVPQHLRPSGRSLPLWRKTVANPKSEIFKLSEKEIYKKIHFWVNKIILLTTHRGFSIRASGWQNLPAISLTVYFSLEITPTMRIV